MAHPFSFPKVCRSLGCCLAIVAAVWGTPATSAPTDLTTGAASPAQAPVALKVPPPKITSLHCPAGTANPDDRCFLLVVEDAEAPAIAASPMSRDTSAKVADPRLAAANTSSPAVPSLRPRPCPAQFTKVPNDCYLMAVERRTKPTKPVGK